MRRVVITRPRLQADGMAEGLRAAGYEVILFPVIEIRVAETNPELSTALGRLNEYAWIVFTSANAVDVVFRNSPSGTVTDFTQGPARVAAIGPKTARRLRAHGISPDFVPEEYVAEAIVPGLGDLHGKRVLLPRAEIARKALPEAIVAAGGVPHEIAVYQTLPAEPTPEGLAALRAGVDAISVTSPSTVESFAALMQHNGLDPLHLPGDPLLACIGPITERAARSAGFKRLVVADEYTAEGLIQAIRSALGS